MQRLHRNRRRAGFSLIELVVVLMIIAIVSGLTVSIVGWLRRSADKGTASNVMASLLSNIELYRTTLGTYPDRYDSLLDGTGALYAGGGTSGDTGLAAALRSSDIKLTTTTIADSTELGSLKKIGITTVMDHVPDSGVERAPGSSGTALRALAASGNVATINTANKKGRLMYASIYPLAYNAATDTLTPVPGVKLVVFGFGPANSAVGKTIVAPPSYSGVGDPSAIYDRYLCVFAVYADGKRAQLKSVMDSTGDFLSQELSEFWDNKPE